MYIHPCWDTARSREPYAVLQALKPGILFLLLLLPSSAQARFLLFRFSDVESSKHWTTVILLLILLLLLPCTSRCIILVKNVLRILVVSERPLLALLPSPLVNFTEQMLLDRALGVYVGIIVCDISLHCFVLVPYKHSRDPENAT
jgi:hypothetical protein